MKFGVDYAHNTGNQHYRRRKWNSGIKSFVKEEMTCKKNICVFWKFVKKFQDSLKCDEKKEYFTQRPMYIFDSISLSSFQNDVLAKPCRETLFIYLFIYLFLKSHGLWDNVEKYCRADRPQMTIWLMRITCWIPKATDAHSEYVIPTAFHCHNGCTKAPQYYVIRTLLSWLLDEYRNFLRFVFT